jgi:hypothetical protein
VGWKGSPSIRWNLLQDRKALVATPANFLAYFVFAYFILYQLLEYFYSQYIPPLIIKGTLLWYLVVLATFFMIWRSINRAYAVNKIYGFWPAVTSVPRVVWGNIINFFAIVRAVYQFTMSRIRGKKLAWDKTAHQVPMVDMDEENEGAGLSPLAEKPMASLDLPTIKIKIKTAIANFKEGIQSENEDDRVDAIHAIDRDSGSFLYPDLVKMIHDPSWRIRAEVCRTLSFLCYFQAVPLLEKAATDPDWTVRSNAVRAIGKLGDLGEHVLLRILKRNDRYAREAALAVLEHQGFLDRNTQRLSSPVKVEVTRAIKFLQILDEYGQSRLAKAALESFLKEIKNQK